MEWQLMWADLNLKLAHDHVDIKALSTAQPICRAFKESLIIVHITIMWLTPCRNLNFRRKTVHPVHLFKFDRLCKLRLNVCNGNDPHPMLDVSTRTYVFVIGLSANGVHRDSPNYFLRLILIGRWYLFITTDLFRCSCERQEYILWVVSKLTLIKL